MDKQMNKKVVKVRLGQKVPANSTFLKMEKVKESTGRQERVNGITGNDKFSDEIIEVEYCYYEVFTNE